MNRRQFAIVAILTLFSIAPVVTSAAGFVQIVPADCTGSGGCQSICDLAQLAQNILNDGIYFAVFISAVMFAWAGFRLLTAQGKTEQMMGAKSIFTNVAIGLVIILSAWLVVDTLMKTLTGGSFGPWNSVCSN